ncbi:hypothetical protein [Chryseobacterium sp.]|uniref:hypothetical protein n=1 Tax=Chryseobacterium sp. TaxID=1871047 RepID=UPI0028974515|nr:hypothetical protein [Chryseobacterium sp.]
MPNTSKNLIISKQAQPTTLATLKTCSGKDAFSKLAKIEQSLTVSDIFKGELIMTQGSKIEVIKEIIKIIEFYLNVVGKELEIFQIQVLAGDLYAKFKTDTLDDIILFFKMIRNDELGKVKYHDTFRDKIISYVKPFMQYKSEERERLIKIKNRKFKAPEEKMSDEAFEKFTQLQNMLTTPVQKTKEIFSVKSVLNSIDNYLETLPETCKRLSDSDLKFEIRRTQYNNKIAHEILLEEQERRKTENKSKKKKKDG